MAYENAIGTFGDFDEKRVGAAFVGVVLEQAEAEAARLDADGVVDGGVVGGVAVEDVDGDALLLERLIRVGDGVVQDVSEKALTATCRICKVADVTYEPEVAMCRGTGAEYQDFSVHDAGS